MPDDHSEVVPLLPIPNRTVKRLCADDSADSRVKVGHRQATQQKRPVLDWAFFFNCQLAVVEVVYKLGHCALSALVFVARASYVESFSSRPLLKRPVFFVNITRASCHYNLVFSLPVSFTA